MNNLGSSRPLPTYTLLALPLLAVTPSCFAAEDASAAHAPSPNDVVNVDPQLLDALLTPISHLVVSPYENPAAVDNPLGVERKPTLKTEALNEETLSILSLSAIDDKSYEPLPPGELSMTTPKDLLSSAQPLKEMRILTVMQR